MSVSIWQDLTAFSKKSPIECDVIIIGAGLAGMSTAYWLQKEDPTLKIAILEKGIQGNGASGRNAGFITCGSVEHFNRLCLNHGNEAALSMWRYSETNLNLLKEHIINPAQTQLYFEQKGSFSLASTDIEFNELKKSHMLMQDLSINSEVVEHNQLTKRLNVEGFVGGIKYLDDASIHPLLLLKEINKNLNSNITLYENHEVFAMESVADKKVVKTNQHYFQADIVIMATNGYSSQLNSYFSDKIAPTRGQILCTEALPHFMEGPCYANFVLDYFRQLPTGELIIGGFRQLQKDVEIGYSDETSDVIQKALEEFISHHIPKAKSAKITHRWSGIMGFSSDGHPMVGSLPTDNQIFYIGGFTAHGLGLTFHTGKCLVDLIYGRKIPEFISGRRF